MTRTDDPDAAIEKAKLLILGNRELVDAIENDRPRERTETLRARAKLRRARRIIRRASLA